MSSLVAVVQLTSTACVQQNLNAIEQYVANAANKGAQLIILPENSAWMGSMKDSCHEQAEWVGSGRIQDRLACLAQRYRVWIVLGSLLTRTSTQRLHTTSFVWSDAGLCVGYYHKIHLFDVTVPGGESHQESTHIQPGSAVVTVETPFGCLGLSICYDLRFPELYRQLAEKGATLFVVPAAFTAKTGAAHWSLLLRARAIENLCYVLAANQCGVHEHGRQTYGHSSIVDPWGNILVDAGDEPGVVTAEIDLGYLHQLRHQFPCHQHHVMV